MAVASIVLGGDDPGAETLVRQRSPESRADLGEGAKCLVTRTKKNQKGWLVSRMNLGKMCMCPRFPSFQRR